MLRLSLYYALHTFINSFRKLFKTWVLIFIIVCVLIGFAAGFVAAFLSDDEEYDEPPAGDAAEDDAVDLEQALSGMGLTVSGAVELAAGAVCLLMLTIYALNADKNGSRIFQPADVNLLFASPLAPQSVLMFRTLTQMGVSALAGIYLLFQLPNLVLNLGLGLTTGLALILAWCLLNASGVLIQVLLYIVCSSRPGAKRYLRPTVYAILVLIAAAYFAKTRSGGSWLAAAVSAFNAPWTRFIPFLGWIKAMCLFASEGRLGPFLGCAAATLAGCGALIYLIWHVRADFYEDAMAKSEETAQLLAQANSEKPGVMQRKKDRSDRLRRDGFDRGNGANVFFFKAMYNRFRFAKLRVLTWTNLTYAGAVLAVWLLTSGSGLGLTPAALTLGVMVFFRALGNPLEQDTAVDLFITVPESGFAKLGWSLLGGAANCLLDILPAVLIGAALTGAPVTEALLWLPVIVSVDMYASTVGAFIFLSVPTSAGRTLKQLIQVLFVYFGLAPDIVIVAVLLTAHLSALAMLIPAALNLLLTALFLTLSANFVGP